MALVNKLGTLKLVTPDGNKIPLTDATGKEGDKVYTASTTTVGEYIETINTTGYGATNGARDTFATLVVGKYKGTKGDSDVSFDAYNAITADKFYAKATVDGWYVFNLITIPAVQARTDLASGETKYVKDELAIVKYDGTTYKVLPASDFLGTAYCSATVDQLFLAKNSTFINNLVRQKIKLHKANVNGINDREIARIKLIIDQHKTTINGAIYEFCRGNKTNAQDDVEFLNTNVDAYELH